MKKTFILIYLLLAASFTGCGGDESTNSSTASNISYPSLYIEIGLPQYPDADIVNSWESTEQQRFTVTLNSTQDKEEIKDYFKSEMLERGYSTTGYDNPSYLNPEMSEIIFNLNDRAIENIIPIFSVSIYEKEDINEVILNYNANLFLLDNS